MQGFRNAAAISKDNREGLLYVASRVNWYWQLFNSKHPEAEDKGLRSLLETPMIALYRSIITYQMRSAGFFYSNQLGRAALDFFNMNDCIQALKDIKKQEREIMGDWKRYYVKDQWTQLVNLERRAEELKREMTSRLDRILQKMEATADREAEQQAEELVGLFAPPTSDEEDEQDETDKEKPTRRESLGEIKSPRKGTCRWFRENSKFLSWDDGILVVAALPGQGKTVLANDLVRAWMAEAKDNGPAVSSPKDHVAKPVVCHFFFKATSKSQQKASTALCSLVHQLLCQNRHVARNTDLRRHVNSNGRKELTIYPKKLLEVLGMVLGHVLPTRPVVVVVDALDESDKSEFIAASLISLCDLTPAGRKLKILVTTRPVPAIMDKFKNMGSGDRILSPKDRADLLAEEIDAVMKDELGELAKEKRWSDSLQTEITKEMAQDGVSYTYLWLRLLFQLLRRKTSRTDQAWIKLIRDLRVPRLTELEDDPYEATMASYAQLLSECDQVDDVRNLFRLMIAAPEPMNLSEINVALRIAQQGDQEACAARETYMKTDEELIVWIEENSGFLVEIYDHRAHFIHQTAKEFLTTIPTGQSTGPFRGFSSELNAHAVVRDLCAQHLQEHIAIWKAARMRNTDSQHRFGRFLVHNIPRNPKPAESFLMYALNNCEVHVRAAPVGPSWQGAPDVVSYWFRSQPVALVRSGKAEKIIQSAQNQHFAWYSLSQLRSSGNTKTTVQIPEVFQLIQQFRKGYLIMENMAAESQNLASLLSQKALSIPHVTTLIADAVRTLWSFPVDGLPIGPVGGGPIPHALFEEAKGSRKPDCRPQSLVDLEAYENKACIIPMPLGL